MYGSRRVARSVGGVTFPLPSRNRHIRRIASCAGFAFSSFQWLPGLFKPNGVVGGDRLVREYHPAIDQPNRKLPCPCLLRPGDNTARRRATTGVDRRTICRVMLNHGSLSVLVHPNTTSPRRDHLVNPVWIGAPLDVHGEKLPEESELEHAPSPNTHPTLPP